MKTVKWWLLVGGLALAGCGSDEAVVPGDSPKIQAARQLTHLDDVFEANPMYSPDGQWIVYESEAAGNRDLWLLPAAGGAARQLTNHPAFDSSPYWSPDGHRIAFESDRSGRKNIWFLDLREPVGTPVAVTSGNWDDGSPAWSPDGTRIVYESNRSGLGSIELWVSAAAGGPGTRLTHSSPGVYHRTADWSPDSRQLVFESDRESGQPALFIMGANGGGVRRLTPLAGYEGHPAWSPDGQRIVFEATTSGSMEIWVVGIAGGDARQVTNNGGFWPRWSPDGTTVVFANWGDQQPNLWSVPVDR